MEIHITKNKTLREISEEFNQKFPYLKLDFYAHTHQKGQGTPISDRLDLDQTIAQVGNFDHDEDISIHANQQVRTLEQTFQEHYGIGVQVLRKSGRVWLQSTATDSWTLHKQNEVGKEDSLPVDF